MNQRPRNTARGPWRAKTTRPWSEALDFASIVAGWALSRWPTILPGLTVHQVAAGHDTLVWVLACLLGGAAILFPALGLLFRLALAGRFQAPESTSSSPGTQPLQRARPRLSARLAVACLIAGFLLLNIADAQWAHAVGLVCLLAFVLVAFRAIIFTALQEQPSTE